MRLVGDDAPRMGRLEVYSRNQWGSVCAFNSQGEKKFGYLEASVVCRSLNFQGAAREPYLLERFVLYIVHAYTLHVYTLLKSLFNICGLYMFTLWSAVTNNYYTY